MLTFPLLSSLAAKKQDSPNPYSHDCHHTNKAADNDEAKPGRIIRRMKFSKSPYLENCFSNKYENDEESETIRCHQVALSCVNNILLGFLLYYNEESQERSNVV